MEPTITAVATGVASLGAGLFGWLRGRSETATAEAKAQTEQLATLTKAFEAQAKTSQILMDRSQRQSEKISQLSAKLDATNSDLAESRADCKELREQLLSVSRRLREVEAERDLLRNQLTDSKEQMSDLQAQTSVLLEHCRALSAQVEELGHQPAPAPERGPDGRFQAKKRGGKKNG